MNARLIRCLTPVLLAILALTALAQSSQQAKDMRLHLRTGTFDPAVRPPKTTDAAVARYWIVQFQRSLTREERLRYQKQYGLRLSDYLPNYAYLERIDAATLDRLGSDPLYRASTPWTSELKVDPSIGKQKFRTKARQTMGGVWVRLILFDDADPQMVVQAAQRAEGKRITVQDDRKGGGRLRVSAVLPSIAAVRALAQRPEVRWVEEVPEHNLDNGTTAGTIQSGTPGTTPVWAAGIHGEGQIIGHIDGPVDINHCFFRDNVDNTVRPAHRKVVGFRNPGGSALDDHGTFTAGIALGDDFNNSGADANRGMAWAARLSFTNLADVDSTLTLLEALNAARADGATIHTNSWHNDTLDYTQDSADVDTFVWNNEEQFVCGSSGNTGESIGPPGTAKDALNVSASARSPNQNNFGDGNMGPTSDGRRKPEIFAPGCTITSSQNGTACTTATDAAIFGFGPICATSWATPAMAGSAALVRQYYTEGFYPSGTREAHNAFVPSGALIKATLLNGTLDMTGIAGYPGTQEGWGLLRLNNVLFLPGAARGLRVWDTANAHGLLGGDTPRVHTINVANNTQPLRVTLVWTEPPAAAGAANSPVNDLNLTVTSPDGTQTFRGNVFAGGVSTTGGAADTVNNVEMVLVNTPAAGNWTATVTPATVNVGNPGQGYALVATAAMPAPPSPIGTQNTLVVRVNFSDIFSTVPLANLQTKMTNVIDYFHKTSYNQVDIVPTYREVNLTHPTAQYYAPSVTPLIELTQDVVAALVSVPADAHIFDTIDRMILVTNDDNFNDDWATTGPWPYDLPGGFTRPISVSIQGVDNNEARIDHGLGHQFNLVDLYAHPGVTFPRAYADNWDNMARPFGNQQFLTWQKERATWVSTPGAQITFIPRPAVTSNTGPLHLFNQEQSAVHTKMIAIGLTPGVASLANETQFYVVESRDNTADYESALPSSGVLIYLVNTHIPQGQGPVILRDPNGATAALEAFTDGSNDAIPGTGITVHVNAGTAGAAHDITVDYTPPVTTHNLRITRGDTINGQFFSWFSPDIWLDSPKDGFNLAAGPPPSDHPERPVVGMPNKVMVRIFNDGPAPADNFDVRVRISQPYHTLGNEADFNAVVGIQHVTSLLPGTPMILAFDWTPIDTGENHSCVFVDFINTTGTDTNPNDDSAQENLEKVTSVTGSPFHPVDVHFQMRNPYSDASLFYFRANSVPPHWSVVFNPPKVRLAANERMEGVVTITPPPDEKICTSRAMEITSWTPRGDTLIEVGGSVVSVDLRRPTLLTLDAGEENCRGESVTHVTTAAGKCRRITAHGCTNPPQPNQTIWVKYVSSDGQVVWHQVTTDAAGCFDDFLAVGDSSTWTVTAGYDGSDCQGPATEGPKSGGPDNRGLWYSMHLGHNYALGNFRHDYQSGPSLTFDIERPYRERISIYGMLGYHYFDARSAAIDDTWITNLSVNLRLYGPAGSWRRFVGFGPGIYRERAGTTAVGGNLSTGLDFPILPKFAGEVGADLHLLRSKGESRVFLDLKLGFKWQF